MDNPDNSMLQILFFAVVAALVLARLYQVLGQNRGAEPPQNRRDPAPVPITPSERRGPPADADGSVEAIEAPAAPAPAGPAAAGLGAIMAADASFRPEGFLQGARGAYEMIVSAYGSGDEATLRPLLTDDVYEAYAAAIAERRAAGAPRIEVVRLSDARIVEAELDGRIARVDVAFSSDLADGGDGLRATDEIWTFERDTGSRDPNWRLSAVQTA